MKSPIDILWELILMPESMKRGVGETVARLPEEKRKILRELTSEDTQRMRNVWTYYAKR